MERTDLSYMREQYAKAELDPSAMRAHPMEQFEQWFAEATTAQVPEPNAMVFSTVGLDGAPSSRVVLLKGFDENGFEFFTHYSSQKSIDVSIEKRVALVFFWQELQRQVRITGTATRLSEQRNNAYFATRPRASQVGAWASKQSECIPSRDFLLRKYQEMEQQFEGKEVPRPKLWGGFVVQPSSIEFWQGRPDRLHDRIRYTLNAKAEWILERLSP